MLQIVDSPQRTFMGFSGRPCHGIFYNINMIVVLMSIYRRIMNTDICQATDHIEGINPQPFQKDLKIRCKECAVTALGD